MQERDQEKFYRIFAFWDGEYDSQTLILCTHGLDKKTNKTPKSDIERALKIKKSISRIKINNENSNIIGTQRQNSWQDWYTQKR
ncbi:MAG: type II toxin-antitoxin system RelE/ParE family toxin [Saprospiraceae bacterium]|nr:type II toxin-antitoxin system RelE/ParE family toxin [Saprospiraceae bacterium]